MKKFNFAPAVGFCFLLLLAAVLAVTGCTKPSGSDSYASQPFFVDFDEETFNREREAWEAQGFANYSFVEKNEHPADPSYNYIGCVTVSGNTISDIEIQRLGPYWWDVRDDFPNGLSDDDLTPAKGIASRFGDIGSIYDRILSAHQDIYSAYQELSAILSKEQYEGLYLSSDIRYNEQYHYPEYAFIRVNKGVDFWIVGLLPNFNIELSDFQITE